MAQESKNLSVTEEMLEEFDRIIHRLYRGYGLVCCDIGCALEEFSIPYLAGINYALGMTPEQWSEYEAIKDRDKLMAYDKEKMKPLVDMDSLLSALTLLYHTADDDLDSINDFKEDALLSFDAGIYKVGRDLGKYPK